MKKKIRLTESDLHRIVKESVNRIIKESTHNSREMLREWEDDDDLMFVIDDLCCGKHIQKAEKIITKKFGVKYDDGGIDDGIGDGVYLRYRSYSFDNGKKNIKLYYPDDTFIVSDTRYYES